MSKLRLVTIDYLIVILMIFVIIGHCMFSFTPFWYTKLHTWIYSFHMGAFYFVVGILVKYNYKELNSWKEYWTYLSKRLKKFGYPFLILGTLLTTYYVFKINGNWHNFLTGMKNLFIKQTASEAIYLWFIFVLFQFYILTPLFCQYYRFSVFPGIALGLILSYYPLTTLFSLHLFSRFFIFFLAGIIFQTHHEQVKKIPYRIYAFVYVVFVFYTFLSKEDVYLYTCAVSIPLLFYVSKKIAEIGLCKKYVTSVSRNCFSIYLFQMIILHLLSFVFVRLPKNNVTFICFLFVGVCFSIIGSLLLDKLIFLLKSYITKKQTFQPPVK